MNQLHTHIHICLKTLLAKKLKICQFPYIKIEVFDIYIYKEERRGYVAAGGRVPTSLLPVPSSCVRDSQRSRKTKISRVTYKVEFPETAVWPSGAEKKEKSLVSSSKVLTRFMVKL